MALHYNLKNIPNQTWKINVPKEEYEAIQTKQDIKNKELKKEGKKAIDLMDFNNIHIEGNKYWKLNPVTNMLIFACGLTVGIEEITEHNFLKVYNRISIWEKVFGTFIITSITDQKTKLKTNQPRPFTLEDIKNHIGLSVNLSNKIESKLDKQGYIMKLNKEFDRIDL